MEIFSGAAQADVQEKSGQEKYNAKITAVWSEEMGEGLKQMTEALSGLCVILEGGEKVYGKGKKIIVLTNYINKSIFRRSWPQHLYKNYRGGEKCN